MENESRIEQEDRNWNAGLGRMASLLGSFALYGAAMGAYITLMN